MLAMLVLSVRPAHVELAAAASIWGIGSFVTFLLMFGQLHIPLSLFLVVALVVGGVGMSLPQGASPTPARSNAYRALAAIGLVGLVLRIAGILPAWSFAIAPLQLRRDRPVGRHPGDDDPRHLRPRCSPSPTASCWRSAGAPTCR